ncbi:hypothetical protein AADZ91_17730 [Colwelliaceae bacterium 6441]
MHNSKRDFLRQSTVALASLGMMPLASASISKGHNKADDVLDDLTCTVVPISTTERLKRIKKAQQLVRVHDVNALVLEPGASMTYFSGINWWRSERSTKIKVDCLTYKVVRRQ